MAAYRVTVYETGESFLCAEDEFVLTAMMAARRGPIRYGCCGGGCGVCRMRVVSGSYKLVKRMSRAHVSENDELEGIVLLCCVQPLSDLTVALPPGNSEVFYYHINDWRENNGV